MLFRVAGQLPLTTLLAWAWLTFAIEADNAVEAAGSEHLGRLSRISMAMWANGLRLIGEEGVTVGELQARAKANCNIGGLERWGWISVGEPGGKRRAGYGTHRGVKGDTVLRPSSRWVVRPPGMAAPDRHRRGEVASTVRGRTGPLIGRSATPTGGRHALGAT